MEDRRHEVVEQEARNAIRRFAYDSQLQLFPDPQVETARKDLRRRLDAGEEIPTPYLDINNFLN